MGLLWGGTDFMAGLNARAVGVKRAVFFSQAPGLVLMTLLLAAVPSFILKAIGTAAIIWLGINLWRSEPGDLSNSSQWSLFRQGLLSAISNPKALLLFTAFITPFIDPHQNLLLQTVSMALTYSVVEFAVEFGVASAANRVRPWLARAGRRFNRVCGGFFVAFGALLPIR